MAVSEETLPTTPSLRVSRRVVLLVAFALAALFGVGAVTAGAVAFHESLAGRILPGVSIDGLDVGGLTRDDARAALADRYRPLATGGLVVRTALGSTTIAFADVARAADVDAMVAEAAAIGRGGTWFDETIAAIRTRLEPRSVALRLTYDPSRASAAVHEFVGWTAVRAVDASAARSGSGFATVASIDGRRIDEAATIAAVNAAMTDRGTVAGTVIEPAVTTTRPRLLTVDADRAIAAAKAMSATGLTLSSGTKTWTVSASRIRTWIGFGWVDGGYRPILDRS